MHEKHEVQPDALEKGPGLHQKIFSEKTSAAQKYKDLYIGKKGFGPFLRYEILMVFLSHLAGAAGFFLRRQLYPSLFKSVGKNVIFGKHITLRHPHKITIGDNVIFDDNVVLDAKGDDDSGIAIGDFVTIGRNSALICKNGFIEIGSHVNITTYVNIGSGNRGRVRIGDHVEIGSFNHFSGWTYDIEADGALPSSGGGRSRGIVVEDLVWTGAGVILLDGVHIGKNTIVGAGSLVNRDFPADAVIFGVPARKIRDRGRAPHP